MLNVCVLVPLCWPRCLTERCLIDSWGFVTGPWIKTSGLMAQRRLWGFLGKGKRFLYFQPTSPSSFSCVLVLFAFNATMLHFCKYAHFKFHPVDFRFFFFQICILVWAVSLNRSSINIHRYRKFTIHFIRNTMQLCSQSIIRQQGNASDHADPRLLTVYIKHGVVWGYSRHMITETW